MVSCPDHCTYSVPLPQSSDVAGYDDYVEGVEPEETASLDLPIAEVSLWEGPQTGSGTKWV